MARRSQKHTLSHSLGRTLAATLGTVPVSLALGAALTLALPLPIDVRVLVGRYSVLPIWVLAACGTFLARDARRAWWALGSAALFAAVVSLLACVVRARLAAGGLA